MNSPPRPQKIRVDHRIQLEQYQSWSANFHVFDEESAFAIEMALATGRPLLVRGEPGIGKSQLARAAAQELNRCFIAEIINLTVEGQDLLWQYDPVARLNDAQVLAAETALAVRQNNPRSQDRKQDALATLEQEDTSPLTDVAKKKKTARYKRKKKSRR
ncbi:MAG: hypothetical protein D3923_15300, partial [Candidatus Electrothrix sp. AR3]|nr:hypothetical protein [Candidatus Electrothrix sp. AR3]